MNNSKDRFWEPHDLAFHQRSRGGFNLGPLGATFPKRGVMAPLPARKPAMSGRRILLPEVDRLKMAQADAPFQAVLDRRRSIRAREAGRRALSLAGLGEFLSRVAHVQESSRSGSVEIERRPCPSGGALHELEIYLTVRGVRGLEAGLYHYQPVEHALYALPATPAQCRAIRETARQATGASQLPVVFFTMTARIGRVAWKYEGMAYRTILLNAGALMQTMYLAAAAMGLAPCAIGNGDSRLFARAAQLDEKEEPAVAEFALW